MIGDGLFVEAGVLSACSRLRRETPECSEVTAVFTRKERSVKKINNHIKYRVSCGPWTETISKYYILRSWF